MSPQAATAAWAASVAAGSAQTSLVPRVTDNNNTEISRKPNPEGAQLCVHGIQFKVFNILCSLHLAAGSMCPMRIIVNVQVFAHGISIVGDKSVFSSQFFRG